MQKVVSEGYSLSNLKDRCRRIYNMKEDEMDKTYDIFEYKKG
ncbi:hypothetical protein SAMN05428988_5924 [Chitinophaga sp. YR573]|nr:hypothetical protein [Chitinophaga sp. YR573]SEW45041.1 hypothetical protein SAMN05428988_5924 [Chitinophaga sp. YR573]